MADGQEVSPTEFQLNPTINFEAKDVVESLGQEATLDLIEELDSEVDSWEATILMARYFERASKLAPQELLSMTDEQLEGRLALNNAEDE